MCDRVSTVISNDLTSDIEIVGADPRSDFNQNEYFSTRDRFIKNQLYFDKRSETHHANWFITGQLRDYIVQRYKNNGGIHFVQI